MADFWHHDEGHAPKTREKLIRRPCAVCGKPVPTYDSCPPPSFHNACRPGREKNVREYKRELAAEREAVEAVEAVEAEFQNRIAEINRFMAAQMARIGKGGGG